MSRPVPSRQYEEAREAVIRALIAHEAVLELRAEGKAELQDAHESRKALFECINEQEQRYAVDVVFALNG